jgi:hypothetical protein
MCGVHVYVYICVGMYKLVRMCRCLRIVCIARASMFVMNLHAYNLLWFVCLVYLHASVCNHACLGWICLAWEQREGVAWVKRRICLGHCWMQASQCWASVCKTNHLVLSNLVFPGGVHDWAWQEKVWKCGTNLNHSCKRGKGGMHPSHRLDPTSLLGPRGKLLSWLGAWPDATCCCPMHLQAVL